MRDRARAAEILGVSPDDDAMDAIQAALEAFAAREAQSEAEIQRRRARGRPGTWLSRVLDCHFLALVYTDFMELPIRRSRSDPFYEFVRAVLGDEDPEKLIADMRRSWAVSGSMAPFGAALAADEICRRCLGRDSRTRHYGDFVKPSL